MTDYTKAHIDITTSEQSDYSDPEWVTNWADYSLTPDEHLNDALEVPIGSFTINVAADTTLVNGMVYDLSHRFDTVTLLAIKNIDTSNYVDANFMTSASDVGGAGSENVVRIPAGGLFVISDVLPVHDLELAANGAPVKVKIVVVGT